MSGSKVFSEELSVDNIIEKYGNGENILKYIKNADINCLSDGNFLEKIFNNSQIYTREIKSDKLCDILHYLIKIGISYNLSDLINSDINPQYNGILYVINYELKYYKNILDERYKKIKYNKNILFEILKSKAILSEHKDRVFKFVYNNLDYTISTDKDSDGNYMIYYMVGFYNNEVINLFTSDQIIETLINILFYSNDINYGDLRVRSYINNMISKVKIEDLKKALNPFSDNIDNYDNRYIQKLIKGIIIETNTKIIEEDDEDEFSFI